MKRFFIASMTIILIALFLTSCKDDPTVQEMLQGKWVFDRRIETQIANGNVSSDTNYANPGDYFEFMAGNTYKYFKLGEFDSGIYEVIGKDKVVLRQYDTVLIRSVFQNSLTMGKYEVIDPDNLYELSEYYYR